MNRANRGFTLIEVLVALTVFIIGVVALYPLFTGVLPGLRDSENRLTALRLAEEKIDGIKRQGFTPSTIDTPKTAFPAPYQNYSYEIKWQDIDYDVITNAPILKKCEVIVYFPTRRGEAEEHFPFFISRKRV